MLNFDGSAPRVILPPPLPGQREPADDDGSAERFAATQGAAGADSSLSERLAAVGPDGAAPTPEDVADFLDRSPAATEAHGGFEEWTSQTPKLPPSSASALSSQAFKAWNSRVKRRRFGSALKQAGAWAITVAVVVVICGGALAALMAVQP